jgi:formate dehydrogenase subunit gamma
MRRESIFCWLLLGLLSGGALLLGPVWAAVAAAPAGPEAARLTADYRHLMSVLVTADWQNSGRLFIDLQQNLFNPLFGSILVVMAGLFLCHYLCIGPKSFPHTGEDIDYYSFFCRLIHLLAALSFTVLLLSGLVIVFGRTFGAGPAAAARFLHLPAALVFVPAALLLFLIWVVDMLPAAYDLEWLRLGGGYLSKRQQKVPAGKFNLGQKSWFWLAVIGGAVMAYSGYRLYDFAGDPLAARQALMLHHFLGAVFLVMFMVHLYMAVIAVKGSLKSMLTGRKAAAEVVYMHGKYAEKLGLE